MQRADFIGLCLKIFTFLGFFFLLFEIFAELLMLLCDLVDEIFVIYDLSGILQHVFLHFIDDYLSLELFLVFDAA